jgi:hypothetical protein
MRFFRSPHVIIVTEPERIVQEADRLHQLVSSWGISIDPLGVRAGPAIQATCDPGDKSAILFLEGVSDDMLKMLS